MPVLASYTFEEAFWTELLGEAGRLCPSPTPPQHRHANTHGLPTFKLYYSRLRTQAISSDKADVSISLECFYFHFPHQHHAINLFFSLLPSPASLPPTPNIASSSVDQFLCYRYKGSFA